MKKKLLPCPSDRCQGEIEGKRPLVKMGEICSYCDSFAGGW